MPARLGNQSKSISGSLVKLQLAKEMYLIDSGKYRVLKFSINTRSCPNFGLLSKIAISS